jgi:uncharacterized protein YciI
VATWSSNTCCDNADVDLEAFELVLLRRPPDAPSYPEDMLRRIQEEHLAYHAQLREAGDVVTNGPVSDQPDCSLRGLTFYRTGSLARSRQLAEADPAVRAGRLAVELMTVVLPARNHEPAGPQGLAAMMSGCGSAQIPRLRTINAQKARARLPA